MHDDSAPSHAEPELTLATPTKVVKLDLGCGQNPAPGFDGVDLNAPNPAHRVDLFKFPWPFETSSVDEIHCSHFIEHIPNRDLEGCDILVEEDYEKLAGKDMFFAFFDECYRILKPEGWIHLVWPSLRSNRAFQDPTHRRFIPAETMLYLSAQWRKDQGLDHYRVECNFGGDVTFSSPTEIGALHPEAQARHVNNFWNSTFDFQAKLKSRKTTP